MINTKPKVLLVVDVPGWAWDHKANALMRNLKNTFTFVKAYNKNLTKKMIYDADSVHFFGWAECPYFVEQCTAGVSSHNFEKQMDHAKSLMRKYKIITAVSKIIHNSLVKNKLNDNIILCENGVETDFFIPKTKGLISKKLRVGWVGQKIGRYDQHGYKSVIEPLIPLIQKRSDMTFSMIDNNWTTAISHKDMVSYYQSIDVLLHAGHMTGTPNPVFEAASCGKPSISTKIGAAGDLIINGHNGFVLLKPTFGGNNSGIVGQFINKLIFLAENMELCREMGGHAREAVEAKWSWKEKSKMWIPVFKECRV